MASAAFGDRATRIFESLESLVVTVVQDVCSNVGIALCRRRRRSEVFLSAASTNVLRPTAWHRHLAAVNK